MDISFRCMVYGNPFYISIVAPLATIILKNIIILSMVLSRLHKRRSRCKPMARVTTEARKAFVCNVLLGTTWVLAFFCSRRRNYNFSMVVLYNQFSTGVFYLSFRNCTKSRCEKFVVGSSWEESIIQIITAKEYQQCEKR